LGRFNGFKVAIAGYRSTDGRKYVVAQGIDPLNDMLAVAPHVTATFMHRARSLLECRHVRMLLVFGLPLFRQPARCRDRSWIDIRPRVNQLTRKGAGASAVDPNMGILELPSSKKRSAKMDW